MPKTIVEKISPTGFIADYIKFAQSITDAPIEFHLGAGLTALSTVCGARITYPGFGGRNQWPNLYTLLIAPSGLYRKSTSVGIAEDLISSVSPDLILSGEQSREKFLNLLKINPNVLYPISEFAAVLSMWNRDYAQGFREIVVDLFDCRSEYHRQTVKDGKLIIHKPALNILAASTVDWLREKLTEGDLRGGLMGRFILIPGINKSDDKGLNPVIDSEARQSLVDFLRGIHELDKSWVDVRDILTEYNYWVSRTEKELEKNYNPELLGFQSRIAAHTLKLAVLFAISDLGKQPKYVLDIEHFYKAREMSKWLGQCSAEMVETGFVKSKFEHEVQRLLGYASRNGGISRQEAVRLMHLNVKQFDLVVEAGVTRGQLRIEKEATKTRPAIFYVLAKANENSEVIEI